MILRFPLCPQTCGRWCPKCPVNDVHRMICVVPGSRAGSSGVVVWALGAGLFGRNGESFSSNHIPGTHFYLFLLLMLSSFWTSRGHRRRPFPPPGSCLQFLSRIGFGNPSARRFFIECCELTLSRFPQVNWCTSEKIRTIFFFVKIFQGRQP